MVIQRIQTLFLLLACVLMACFTFMSLGQFQTDAETLNITTCGIYYEGQATGNAPTGQYSSSWFFFIMSLMSAIIPFIAIFLFKNLKLQKSVCIIELLFIAATIIIAGVVGYDTIEGVAPGWSSIAISPFLAFILTLMAWQRINKDKKLLASVDRIR